MLFCFDFSIFKYMRVFVGLPAPANIVKQTVDWQIANESLPVRWIRPEDLHLTLLPPWETADVEATIKQFQVLPAAKIVRIDFNCLELGPNPREPRLIWLTGRLIESPLDNYLKILADGLNQPLPARRFLPHLTVARFRFLKQPLILSELIAWSAGFTRMVLYQSDLGPQGARYAVLAQKELL